MSVGSIGVRIREERERLSFSQTAFGQLVDRGAETVAAWEAGRTSPPAAALATLAANGIDAAYVITGRRTGVPIEDAAAHPERSIRALLPMIDERLRKPLLLTLLHEEMQNEAS